MQARRRREVALPVAGQVTSLELFFDLVFVFTITQLTATVLPGGWAVTGRTALLLLLLWWMYGGYAWLTNAAPPVTPRRRTLLVLGMVGLFVTALAIPHAYGSDRVVFACGYLVVVGAVLGPVGAIFFEGVLVWWWLASFVVAVVLPRLVPITALDRPEDDGGPSFELVPRHFVERHGLMLLIALGESVLAIGVGLGTGVSSIGLDRIGFAAISLLLAATMYWAYFGVGEDARAEAALDGLPPDRAQAAGLASYGYAFWVGRARWSCSRGVQRRNRLYREAHAT
jgi:low temperature requirement protein LtrA